MRTRRRLISLIGAAIAITVAAPSPATGAVEVVTVRQGPIDLAPYQVVFPSDDTRRVRSPGLDGWLVRMSARLVDENGRPLPVQDVMLHHVVYKNRERRDPVCTGTQSFYGTGEENQALVLPRGYGYRVRPGDRWTTGWMLMNHRNVPRHAYIEYTAWVETSRRLRPVVPYWARATGCEFRKDPIYNVPGGSARTTHVKRASLAVAHSGRIVAAGSHLHGGATALELRRPGCGSGGPLLRSRPLYGLPDHPYYNVLPVLHEPGPIATGSYATLTGSRCAEASGCASTLSTTASGRTRASWASGTSTWRPARALAALPRAAAPARRHLSTGRGAPRSADRQRPAHDP